MPDDATVQNVDDAHPLPAERMAQLRRGAVEALRSLPPIPLGAAMPHT